MGSIAMLTIGNYSFLESKNYLNDHMLLIFSENDYSETVIKEDEEYEHTVYKYKTTAKKAKECLDVLGYTSNTLNKFFDKHKEDTLGCIEYVLEDYNYDLDSDYDIAFNNFTFGAWIEAVKSIGKDLVESPEPYYRTSKHKELDPREETARYIVLRSFDDYRNDNFFGLTYEIDPWFTIRVLLDAIDGNTEIELDFSDLIDGGWINADDVNADYNNKIIVMTEGKSDSKILSKSLGILYPHLYHYYYFMDFDTSKAQGSTNFLTHYIKAFIGAGISNRVIALFDNDAAALNEILNLNGIAIPSNMRILTLPEIELASSYPTIGPFESQIVNVNGLACSIELFLGEDVLKDYEGSLIPVIWKSYIDRIKKYQGEITLKDEVQQKFLGIVNKIEEGFMQKEEHDWSTMEILLQTIFNAFK